MLRILVACYCLLFVACSAQREIGKSAGQLLFGDAAIANAHVGISVYDPAAGKYLYNYQDNKYFVPASNTKIFTTYAGLKYLGDSLPGIQYAEQADSIQLFPTGDPTFLHKDFPAQPVAAFLKRQQKPLAMSESNWKDAALGFGWSWDDYNSSYMAERSPFPIYGNLIRFVQTRDSGEAEPFILTEPDINWKLNFNPEAGKAFSVRRQRGENVFRVTTGRETYRELEIPFITNGLSSAIELLKDTVHQDIALTSNMPPANTRLQTIYSQKTDSFLRAMMHHSDNFFSEQTLMMVSNARLGIMDDAKLIDTILNADLKGLPQRPRWVDGSGLSRYNLFTPRGFVWILNRMKDEFTFERLKHIFPTGGQGTLTNYYRADSAAIFAKTGTLSGHLALSGYLVTRSKKVLIFSVLINNHYGSAPAIRRQVEQFLQGISNKY